MKRGRGRPPSFEPPSKEALRQRQKRILAKYADGDKVSDKDEHELLVIRMWQLRPREMEKLYAKLVEEVKEVCDEFVQQSIEIKKKKEELDQLLLDIERDKFGLD